MTKLKVRVRDSFAWLAAGSGSGDLAAQQQAIVILVGLIQTLLPNDTLPEQESQADLDALTKLSKSSTLSGRLEVGSQGDDGFGNVASFAWGIMLSNHGPPNFRSKAIQRPQRR